MNSVAVSTLIGPGAVALLFCLVFAYLYGQSRQPYFRAWQLAWAAYALHCGLRRRRPFPPFLGCPVAGLIALRGDHRTMRIRVHPPAPGPAGRALVRHCPVAGRSWAHDTRAAPWLLDRFLRFRQFPALLPAGNRLAALFAYCAFSFYREAHHRASGWVFCQCPWCCGPRC